MACQRFAVSAPCAAVSLEVNVESAAIRHQSVLSPEFGHVPPKRCETLTPTGCARVPVPRLATGQVRGSGALAADRGAACVARATVASSSFGFTLRSLA